MPWKLATDDDPDPLERIEVDLSLQPFNVEEYLAVIDGEDLIHARKRMTFRTELRGESAQYHGLKPQDWPELVFNWDLRPKSRRFALDGESEDKGVGACLLVSSSKKEENAA